MGQPEVGHKEGGVSKASKKPHYPQ